MSEKMTIDEMIRKWRIKIDVVNGQKGLRIWGKASKSEIEMIRKNKDAIMAKLEAEEKEREQEIEEKKKMEEEKKQRIINDEEPLEIVYFDGEILSAPASVGVTTELLKKLGLVKYISGWGYAVDPELTARYGMKVLYSQAKSLAEERAREKAEKEAKKEAERRAKIEEAKRTGKPVLLRSWMENCCDPSEDCSVDTHYEYAMPDGTVKHTWEHTW